MLTWSHYRAWLGSELVQELPFHLPAPAVTGWCRDSRYISPGQWFVALEGNNQDGHLFVDQALSRGAVGFLGKAEKVKLMPPDLQLKAVCVHDPLLAYQQIARGWRIALEKVALAALTGSVGKTTCKRMLGALLEASGRTLCPEDNYNSETGLPDVLLRLNSGHRYGVLEMGARRPGDIRQLVEIALPDVVACLNAGTAHIGIFGGREALRDTKLEIIRHRPGHAKSVCFHDDPELRCRAGKITDQLITFGRDKKATVRIIKEAWQEDGSLVTGLDIAGQQIEICFPGGHESWPLNAAAACAMAFALQAPLSRAAEALGSFKNVTGRFQVYTSGAMVLIDDTYNANPDSMISGLKTLARYNSCSPKVALLGDMLELGDLSQNEHRKIGSYCAGMPELNQLITIGEEAEFIMKGALDSGMDRNRVIHYADPDALLDNLPFKKGSKLTLFAKASRGLRLERIIEFYKS